MPSTEKIVFRADELVELTTEIQKRSKGRIFFRQVGGDLRNRPLQILHETYEPGADTGRTMLQHASEEGGVVVEGRIELTVGDKVEVLGAGDSYLFDSRQPHRFRNPFNTHCVIVSACTPPYL